jgi:hypothetical protein
MRIFKFYSPLAIAKHVKLFFKGRIYINGRGGYVFERGRVVMPEKPDQVHSDTVTEINRRIQSLS